MGDTHGSSMTPGARKWQQAIEDAELQIADHQKRIRRPRRAIKVFRGNMHRGEPWPGESPSQARKPT